MVHRNLDTTFDPPKPVYPMRSVQVTEFGAPLQLSESSAPQPMGQEVLLETIACGVCHSDVHLWEGYYDLGGGRRSYLGERGIGLPLTLGHETVGRVIGIGPDAENVQVGDVRLVYPWIGCGECRICERGTEHLCLSPRALGVNRPGGYSNRILVPDARYLIEIGNLSPESACSYACAGLTAYSALNKVSPLEEDDTLVVIGAGGVGMMALQLVRHLTSARVIVVDVNTERLETARQLTDCEVVNGADGTAFKQVRAIAGRGGVAAVVDFVGSEETTQLGFGLLARSGVLIVVGLFGGELRIPTPSLPLKDVTIRGSYTGSLVELRELMALARQGTLVPLPVERHPLEDAQDVLERLRDGQIVGRAVLSPALAPEAEPAVFIG